MDAMVNQLLEQLTGAGLSQVCGKLGVDEGTARTALSAALPLLVSALARNASQPQGAQALHTALTNDHDGSILNDVASFLQNPQSANGAGILGHILGSQQSTVTQGLTQGTGMDSAQVEQLLQIAAPLVMGSLGQQTRQQGLDPKGLSAFLGSQQQQAHQSNPDMMGLLNGLLDAGQGGQGNDDLFGALGKMLGGG